VVVMPWHNPVLVAEQVATLDLLSGGRVDFGVGKGYRQAEFDGFCIPIDEATERFDEAMEDHQERAGPARAASAITASAGTTTTSWSSPRPCSDRIRRCGSPPAARQHPPRRARGL
jgi:alkanesulfonate monooxygenase SsuD/methylene tetrahydromethanopterin reductase-like flavin-dependent oxidoreductase (luciferase family)